MSFRFKLILSLILLLIPLIGGEAYFHYRDYVKDMNMTLGMQMDVAQDLARSTNSFVSRTVAIQRAAGEALVISRWYSPQARQKYVESILASTPPLLQMVFADTSGKVIEAAPSRLVGLDISGRDYYAKIRQGSDWAASDQLGSEICPLCGFVIATAIRDSNGTLLGIVASGVDDKKLLSTLNVKPFSRGTIMLINNLGHLVFAGSEHGISARGRDWSSFPFVRSALSGHSEYVGRLAHPGQSAMTGAVVPISSMGWVAGAFVPTAQVVGPVKRSALRNIAITLLVLGVTFLIGSFVAKQMIAPVEQVSSAVQRLGEGELSTRVPVAGTVEFRSLARTINQMAQSIEEAYERERRIATVLQERMLPKVPEKIERLEIATGYFPALEEAELGGDFYDVMLLPNELVGVVIADVSGKGLSAAVHTAMVKYMLEGFASDHSSPAETLRKLNAAVGIFHKGDDTLETFVTCFFAIIDPSTGEITYANAGHPSPLLRRNNGSIEWLSATNGLPLGIMDNAEYSDAFTILSEGDGLLLYTDGVIEGHIGDKWHGMEELASLVGNTVASPSELVQIVYQTVSEFAGGSVQDDVALVTIIMKLDTR